MNKFVFIVPVYRHGSTLESVIASLEEYRCPVIVVDDGNGEEDKKFIRAVIQKYSFAIPVVHEKNGGKGRAVNDGIRKAHELGFTHAIQVDSDGQHDVKKIGVFMELSEKNPGAIICAYPEYDETVPPARLKGRKIANTWAHIVTLSTEIKDALIGFRVYPVEPYYDLLKHHAIIDSHMGYDLEILIRLMWKNVPLVSSGVKVSYPKDGVSNFRVVRDNIHISLAYTRLCIGMILRFPVLLYRALKRRHEKNGKAVV